MAGDTIHALATAPGRAGIAVIRISGSESKKICESLTGKRCSMPRQAVLRDFLDDAGNVIDRGLAVFFEAGRSFTGEDILECQIHGSRAGVKAMLGRLGELGYSRMAEPGEFTRRALLNGHMDLTQVAGLGALLDAETELQRRAGIDALDGVWGRQVRHWRDQLIEAAALLEATIDFADEDVPVDVSPDVNAILCRVMSAMKAEQAGMSAAQIIRDGFSIAIMGRPNVGKSSLMNALTRSDASIVSSVPGTTRDIVEVRLDLGGCLVRLIDTAGLRETSDAVERMGIERALARSQEADFRLGLIDGLDGGEVTVGGGLSFDLVVRTKVDLSGGVGISAHTGEGLDEFLTQIRHIISDRVSGASVATSERDAGALRQAATELGIAVDYVGEGIYDLAAEHIRSAMRVLAQIIGDVDVEDLLDHIFQSFCIGK